MDEEKTLFQGYINPLQFLEVDGPWHSMSKTEPTLENVLTFLCSPNTPSDLKAIIDRYREISIENPRLSIAPDEKSILTKLIWPLRYAKASYAIGNYLGTIALCGMVAEMITILTFDTTNFNINGKEMNESDQSSLFGSKFERLNQKRRVQVLKVYNLITYEESNLFDTIREIRNKYLHLWSQAHGELPKDAIKCFTSAIKIVVAGLGLSVTDGKVNLKPSIIKYMREHKMFSKQ